MSTQPDQPAAPNGDQPPTGPTRLGLFFQSLNPLPLLREAITAVPAVRYAVGVLGIAAALAIALAWFTDLRVAAFGVLVMLALMVLLAIFAALTTALPQLRAAALILAYSVVVFWIASMGAVVSWVLSGWPSHLDELLSSARRIGTVRARRGSLLNWVLPGQLHQTRGCFM
jgi:hypothetical protein